MAEQGTEAADENVAEAVEYEEDAKVADENAAETISGEASEAADEDAAEGTEGGSIRGSRRECSCRIRRGNRW